MTNESTNLTKRLFPRRISRIKLCFTHCRGWQAFHAKFWAFILENNAFLHPAAEQLHHHPWNGFAFWDLKFSPFYVIVGVAIAIFIEKAWLLEAESRH